MEPHEFALTMQEEMIQEIESVKPRFLVFVQTPMSWVVRKDSHRHILEWAGKFIGNYYTIIGYAEIVSDNRSVYRWDEEVADNAPNPKASIVVYERK